MASPHAWRPAPIPPHDHSPSSLARFPLARVSLTFWHVLQRAQSFKSLSAVDGLADWLKHEDSAKVNRRLYLLLQKIVVRGSELEIVFRE